MSIDDILLVTGLVQPAHPLPHGQWTIADYERLPDDGLRYELINGGLRMTPAPNLAHQTTSGVLFYHLHQLIQLPGLGRVFAAPVDVELGPATIVQPDLVVILHGGLAQLSEQRIIGPPDLIIEITSPSTASYDRREKRDLYASVGVREYWIADPASRSIELLFLDGDEYRAEHVYRGRASLPSAVLPQWQVTTDELFG
ncbi:MAG: Uma2 family endonuclease [Oscillochloridaceae bacterium umkhey_bin13]